MADQQDRRVKLAVLLALVESRDYQDIVGEWVRRELADATTVCCTPGKTEQERHIAMGKVEVLSHLFTMGDNARKELELLSESPGEEPPDVGSKLEDQWYERAQRE